MGDVTEEDLARIFVDPTTCAEFTEEHIGHLTAKALYNFDLNMEYFSQISDKYFQSHLKHLLEQFPNFIDTQDLRPLLETPGVYVMVLDDFKQVYIGQSVTIGRRIRTHWSSSKPLDRLVFGAPESSVLSIDSFRALDTTRIYSCVLGMKSLSKRDSLEQELVAAADPNLTLNRLSGGDGLSAMSDAFSNGIKKRDLGGAAFSLEKYPPKAQKRPPAKNSVSDTRSLTSAKSTQSEQDIARTLCAEANKLSVEELLVVNSSGHIQHVTTRKCLPAESTTKEQLFFIPCGRNIKLGSMLDALDFMREVSDSEPVSRPFEVAF